MALLVKKFGGSSVATLDKIRQIALRVQEEYQAGNQVLVVVSAMQGETDRLISLANQLSTLPNQRELDVLLATGEQVTIALLCIALTELGCSAKSYTGAQVKIATDSSFNKARILNIDREKILADLEAGNIVVVAGFQGVDEFGNITTLGRGGSDTTAVALAAVLRADECQIYTDVDGVYTADPRIVNNARRMEQVTFEEMLELSSLGAKVLQNRSVEIAGRYNVPVRVQSTFKQSQGTLISYAQPSMESQRVVGIAHSSNEARILVRKLADEPGYIDKLLGPLAKANIEVDMIVQNVSCPGFVDFAFTVQRNDLTRALSIVKPLAYELQAVEVLVDTNVAKLSIVGIGMRSYAGVASKMFKALGDIGVHIQLISTSEIKVSVILDEKDIENGVRALHKAFELDKGFEQNCQKNPVNFTEGMEFTGITVKED